MKKISNLAHINEEAVVALAKTGNHSAFEELVVRYQSWLRNLLRRLSAEAELADDLTQQVFLQAWKGIKNLQTNKAFGGWLKRLAVTTWLQHIRRHDPLAMVEDSPEEETEPVVLAPTESVAIRIDLDQALAALNAQVRLCVVLSYNEGLSHAMIADLTLIPLGTVKSHINRGGQKLRELLHAYQES